MDQNILEMVKKIPFDRVLAGQIVFFHAKDGKHYIDTLTGREIIVNRRADENVARNALERTQEEKLLADKYTDNNNIIQIKKKRYCKIYHEPEILAPGYLMIRMYKFYPFGVAKQQETREFLRLVIDQSLNIEIVDRDFNVSQFKESDIYKGRSIYKSAEPLIRDSVLNKRIKTFSGNYLCALLEEVGINKTIDAVTAPADPSAPIVGKLYLTLSDFLIVSKKAMRKQWFRSNVPNEMKVLLQNGQIQQNLDYQRIGNTSIFRGYGDSLLCVTDEYYYLFKKNELNGKYSSSDILNCRIPISYIHDDAFVNDELKGTCFERLTLKNVKQANDLIVQYRYLAAEQAFKTVSNPLVLESIKLELYEKRKERLLTPKMSLKEALPVKTSIMNRMQSVHRSSYYFAPAIPLKTLRKVYDCAFKMYHDQELAFFVTYVVCMMSYGTDRRERTLLQNLKMGQSYYAALYRNYKKGMEMREIFRSVNHFCDYIRMRKYVLRLAPKYPELKVPVLPEHIKPSKIDEYHNTVVKLYNNIQVYEQNEMARKESLVIAKRHEKEAADWEYTNGTYMLKFPMNAEEIRNEGTELHHCVGSYCSAVAKGDTTILFLRKVSDLESPLMTMEVRNGTIRQFFAKHDTFNTDPEIAEFVENFAKEKGFEIGCTILKGQPKKCTFDAEDDEFIFL